MNLFQSFPSNIGLGTSNNNHAILCNQTKTFRICLRPKEAGLHNWRFWYSNTVDSTWDTGTESYANMPGSAFQILCASVGVMGADQVIRAFTPVTYDGAACRTVASKECFWSDPVLVDVKQGDYLVFSWCLQAEGTALIPATPDSISHCFCADGDQTSAQTLPPIPEGTPCVLPNLFGADIAAPVRMAFLGDSITQGCGTGVDLQEQWVARISNQLGSKAAVWNLGLGFGRAMDAATDGAWLSKAKQNDVVCVCMGVNDLLQGRSGAQVINDLSQIVDRLKAAKVRVILLTTPPFDFTPAQLEDWTLVNHAVRGALCQKADGLFDIAAVFGQDPPFAHLPKYGPHPDGNGGAAAANAFCAWFAQGNL